MADMTPLRTCSNEEEFNAFLVKIADEITKEEVHDMKFLCLEQNYNLPRGRLDEIKEPREFVSFLRQSGTISPGDVGYLIWLLDNTRNTRLADVIRERGKKIIQGIFITCVFNRLCSQLNILPIFCGVDRSRALSNKRSQFN